MDDTGASDGFGLVLTPSVFTKHAAASWQSAIKGRSWLSYPARGQGTLVGDHAPLDRQGALAGLVGAAKADILLALTEPASTTELA